MHCKLLSCFKNNSRTFKLFLNSIFFNTTLQFVYNQLKIAMSVKHNLTKPPESVRGMTVLDKRKFDNTVNVPVLKVRNVNISKVMPYLKKYSFKMPGLKPVQCLSDDPTDMCVLLNPDYVKSWFHMDVADREILEKQSLSEADLTSMSLTLTYDNYLANDIFRSVLPEDQEGFSSFSQIGHIIHVNLREHLLPYKNLIAEVLLDKAPNALSVVNKIDMIDNTYRNFKMEVLRGLDDMMVRIKENRCEYEFDFAKVYWNPRLSTEHTRIIEMLKPGDVLFDVFAGVGPFAIPAAKKKCIVHANDLNPDSYKWLNHNLKRNKVNVNCLQTYNKDGRDFILDDLRKHLLKYINNHNVYVVMNLPALAVEFLTAFCNLYKESELDEIINPPIVHVYCFAKGENYVDIAKELVFKSIGFDINDKIIGVFRVRTVSSLKEMMRVSFKLDRDILVESYCSKRKHDDCDADAAFTSKKCSL